MLWYKGWLEVRWRLVFALALTLAPLGGALANNASASMTAASVLSLLSLLWMFSAVFLAGAGIRTQSALQGVKGLHGSTQFTLALPASRLRLLGVRIGVGMAATCAVILVSSLVAWSAFSTVRTTVAGTDVMLWIAAGTTAATAVHAIAVLASAILDEYWYVWGAMAAVAMLRWVTSQLPLPRSADPFRALTDASPLLTHAFPWPAAAVALAMAAAVIAMTARVVRVRQY